MTPARMAVVPVGGLLGGAAATWAWLALPGLSPLSERLWTALNHLLGGQTPGAASDLELLLVFGAGAVITGIVLALVLRAKRP
ncbi:hypothetical protein EIP75_00775 [Aquabacterium soli]|jgi:hypothetical protein|uniref:Uncharacterized protein n=1 Tax=Aquabacterium soli TaxID=2493092 RepID=A0A3R8T4S6_9BURK|nr:hypothetical protein [Aquabacterium soli]RRS06167.1 hypothetical protein EIP75_00775 [Aquabacterium soli]